MSTPTDETLEELIARSCLCSDQLCPSCNAVAEALTRLRKERDALRDGIRDAYAEYEKQGAVSTFEGCDMIYASTLEDLFTLTTEPTDG